MFTFSNIRSTKRQLPKHLCQICSAQKLLICRPVCVGCAYKGMTEFSAPMSCNNGLVCTNNNAMFHVPV